MYLSICFLMFFILLIFSMIFMLFGIYFMMMNLIYFIEWNIFSLNSLMIVMTILLDWMSLLFMGLVLFISSMVILYSYNYMFNDLNMNRFILLIFMFVLSMILLIISPNLMSILLGWDGLGLTSYCLVIYYQNVKSFNSGMLTVLSNRIGDIFILMSIAWMLNYGSWNYVFYLNFMKMSFEMEFISMMIFLASITKSAQIPFSSWLPAAMAAPTPVSALVHSSTLVTAGIYLLIRFNNLFINNMILNFMLMISGLTMFMSGLGANFEFDLKKIIALSTLSQLGLMLMILSLGFNYLSFFHLLTHAMFKSLLFLCAGLMIHNLNNIQDIRYMGSFSIQLPMTSICFNFSNLSLCGFPFLSGFYSKDLMLEVYMMMNYNLFAFLILFVSTLMTVSYTFRLIYFTMLGSFNLTSLNFLFIESWEMLFSMFMLLILTIFGGNLLMWLMFPYNLMICLPLFLKIFPLLIIFLGMLIGYYFFFTKLTLLKMKFYFLKNYFSLMWFLPILSTYGIIKFPLIFSKFNYIYMDQGWLEDLGGQGIFLNLKILMNLLEWYHFNGLNKFLMFFFMIYLILMIYFLTYS